MQDRLSVASVQTFPRPRSTTRPVGTTQKFTGLGEPQVSEIMADEVVRRVMARDGVRPEQLISLMALVRTRLI